MGNKNGKKHKKHKKQKQGNGHPSLAERADRHALYQRAVQCPEAEVSFFVRAFRRAFGHKPILLREDFCGTAAVACEWVNSNPRRQAFAVDLDPDPLEWGRRHNVKHLQPNARDRITLVEGDVRTVDGPQADVLAAQNFSFFVFKKRHEVVDYFRTARNNLADQGILVLDVFGGPESITEDQEESRAFDDFEYVWEQRRFDPITHDCTYHIHFRFDDGSEMRRAFTYKWRWWSIPEVREMLQEAGFDSTVVYWEGTDKKTGEGNGVYKPRSRAPGDPAWVSYIIGVKQEGEQP